MNYYNEYEPFAADWLRNLITEGLIPNGEVDTRSICDVQATDLLGYRQCHFFTGIGGWSRALELAGWPADREVWTGSAPCQPFSTAGKQKGTEDKRHLWPVFADLIRQRQPEWIFGEQVSAAIRLGWIDGVRSDLEGAGYAFGFTVLGAHSVGAPHIRQRIFWGAKRVSDASNSRHTGARQGASNREWASSDAWRGLSEPESTGIGERLPNPDEPILRGQSPAGQQPVHKCDGRDVRLSGSSRSGRWPQGHEEQQPTGIDRNGAWSDYTIGHYRDGKARRIGRGVFPLVAGIPRQLGQGQPELRKLARSAGRNRIGRLKGYGNAIVPDVAAVFIRAFVEEFGEKFLPFQ